LQSVVTFFFRLHLFTYDEPEGIRLMIKTHSEVQRCIPLQFILDIYVALLVAEDMFKDGRGCVDDASGAMYQYLRLKTRLEAYA
jgi:hypothetical protein